MLFHIVDRSWIFPMRNAYINVYPGSGDMTVPVCVNMASSMHLYSICSINAIDT